MLSGNYSNPYVSKFNSQTANFVWSSNITLIGSPIAYPEAIPSYTGNVVSLIAMYRGQVIIQNSGEFLSLNESTGEKLWRVNLNASAFKASTCKDTLFFDVSDGNFYALSLSNGSTLWKTKVDSQNLMSTVNNGNITLTAIQSKPKITGCTGVLV